MSMKPAEYLRNARQEFENLPADICDKILDGVCNADTGAQCLYIPDDIPARYHSRMQAAWTAMAYKILFANALRKYSLVLRHKILQKSL